MEGKANPRRAKEAHRDVEIMEAVEFDLNMHDARTVDLIERFKYE